MGDEPQKKKKKKTKAPKLYEQVGYTNEDNPFGDSDLGRKFVWGKKTGDAAPGNAREKQDHYLTEIEKVRKRRQEREEELMEMERLREEEQRLREAESYDDWQAKEEEFHLEQTKIRSRLRLANNRSKPIDIVAKNILMIEEAELSEKMSSEKDKNARSVATGGVKYTSFRKDEQTMRTELRELQVELREPASIVRGGLNLKQLEELREDARAYVELEGDDGEWLGFWRSLVAVADYQISSASQKKTRAVHGAVADDVAAMFENKTLKDLEEMHQELTSNVEDPDSDDEEGPDYWRHVLKECDLAKSLAVLAKAHGDLLRRQLVLTKKRRDVLVEKAKLNGEEAVVVQQPKVVDERDTSRAAREMEEREQDRGAQEDEETMEATSEVMTVARPWGATTRKPRYVNRVKTGYEWNKYNQTHFSKFHFVKMTASLAHEEPPPKVVQGYKFNIFYPDLEEKWKIPTYQLLKCPEGKDLAIIRFTASAPYEDVAFKIVNGEWETTDKKGYRCVFERGILQLHFNFKRWRYRR